MTSDPTIKTLWIGPELSVIERTCLNPFLLHGHNVELFCYSDVGSIPSGVKVRDGNDILGGDKIFTYKNHNSVAPFADWFRYELLRQEGGIWIDTDMICLRRFDFADTLIFGAEDNEKVGIAVLGDEQDSELMAFMSKMCAQPHQPLPWDSKKVLRKKWIKRYFRGNQRGDINWGATGPAGFTNALEHFELERNAKPIKDFYPIHWSCWATIFDETYPDPDRYFPDSYAIHIWNEMLRREGVDKKASFPRRSLIEELKRRYLD
jgi:hypothetical protein